jgi:CHAT domain-containing protein/tetratricopeptide (TPR) repeat protein
MSFNRGLCLTIYICLASASASMLAARAQDRALESGAPVADELATGDTHSYRIPLLADQYVSLRIEQRGVDVAATLIGPDAIKRTDANFVKGTRGAESISIIADVTGDYRLEVRAAEKNTPRGAYEVTLVARRPPTDGERTLEEARRLFDQSRSLRQQGKYTDALVSAERALALREQVLGAEHTMVADSLNQIAILFDDKTDYARAEPPNVRALAIREKALGPDHPDVARSLFNLAWLAKVKEDFQTSESLYRRALDIQERALGPDHSEVATILNDLALLYHDKGNFDEAIRVNERVLAIREKALGPDDDGVAKALHNVANAYANKGDYVQAEALMRRALAIWEKAFGPDHPEVAFALDGLGKALYDNGNYTAAEPLLLRALSIREKAFGPDHAEIGPTLYYLANLYRQKGDYAKAEQAGLRDLALSEKALGPSHAYVATTLVGLATTAALQGEYEKADRLYRRALTIQETSLGPAHPAVGTTLNRLGQLALDSGRPAADAEAFFQRARVTIEKAIGPDSPGVANALSGLATLEERRGGLAEAERYYQQALAVQEKVYGPVHPAVAQSLERLAALGQPGGDVTRPVALLSRAYDIREQYLDHNLVAGSERQKLAYLNLFAQDIDRAVSLHAAAPANADALRLAFTTVLRRKGRAIDATSDNVALVRANASPVDAALFDRLLAVRSQLATVTLRGPSGPAAVYRMQLTLLRGELDRLEADIGARSAEFRAQGRPVTLDSVQAAVPEQAALIEFVSYRPRGAGRETADAPHYAAYVLAHHGEPQWMDLGEASAIDRQVSGWRRALANPSRADAARLARALDARVMQPVRGLIGNARLLLISPDGQLNLMPFAALVDEQRHYLVERYTISYLTSGRDLLRLQIPRESRSRPVIVSAPAFGEPALAPARTAANGASRARVDDSQIFFGPLPGAAGEVRALKALLPDATVLSGREASEAALRRLAGPRILHIATHGFFLDGGNAGSPPAADLQGTRLGKWAAWTENPLLRSGLALAGANQGRIGEDDGVLTAFEAAGLDLWGTKLVVLAACDTGVGEVRNGDGVYGLRRALVLAGSESQMMSLWPVNDRSTRDLMIAYYSRLARSVGRADALRQAQLQLMRESPRRHPYYWASFISSGEWGILSGRP